MKGMSHKSSPHKSSHKSSHKHSKKYVSIGLNKSTGVSKSPVSGTMVPSSYAQQQSAVMRVTAKALRATMRRGR